MFRKSEPRWQIAHNVLQRISSLVRDTRTRNNISSTTTLEFQDFSRTYAFVQVFPGLEISTFYFQDLPGFSRVCTNPHWGSWDFSLGLQTSQSLGLKRLSLRLEKARLDKRARLMGVFQAQARHYAVTLQDLQWRRRWSRDRAFSPWATPPCVACYRRWPPEWWSASHTDHTACPASTPVTNILPHIISRIAIIKHFTACMADYSGTEGKYRMPQCWNHMAHLYCI